MSSFISPKPNSFFIKFTKMVVSVVMQNEHLDVRPSAACVTTLRQLNGTNTVVMMNHADKLDPVAAYALSKHSGDEFLYLAAREQFNKHNGWCMRRAGAYSVLRGQPEDLESKEATISLITSGRRKLLMFPEGDVTGRDDEILPLKEDGLRNIFEAQRRLLSSSSAAPAPVLILPVVAYYEVQDDAIQPMLDALGKLEMKLGTQRLGFSLESRLMRVMAAFLEQVEDYFAIDTNGDQPPDERLTRLVRRVSLSIAHRIGAPVDEEAPENALLYSVRGFIERLTTTEKELDSAFEEKLHNEALNRCKSCISDLDLLQQLLILSSTLQQRTFTLECAWRLVDRLEQIVLGKAFPKGQRVAIIDCAHPIDVLSLWPSYNRDEGRTLQLLDRRVRTAMQDTMSGLRARTEISPLTR